MSGLFHEKEAKIEEIKKRRQQVKKIITKLGGPYAMSEYDAMQKKFGKLPDFWISKESANSEIRLIEEKYNKKLQALAKEENLLKTF